MRSLGLDAFMHAMIRGILKIIILKKYIIENAIDITYLQVL
jgi:hypothetical protein